jgi:predicted nucleotidyltransferase component of viral defense system
MNAALTTLLSQYKPQTAEEYLRALREIFQHLSLLGLWRSGFFTHASFYGGTALRMFHGLPRFSEDLDFSLVKPDDKFAIAPYIKSIASELNANGFEVDTDFKPRNEKSRIESAFVKTDTLKGIISIQAPQGVIGKIHRDARLKIKVELDTNPPGHACHEVRDLLIPIPFQVRLYAMSSLFAGKVHALLCRSWKSRIKGRDFYDFLWFVGMNVSCDVKHLKARLVQSGHFNTTDILDRKRLIALLNERFKTVDFKQAARDVFPFITDKQSINLWSERLFHEATEKIQVTPN